MKKFVPIVFLTLFLLVLCLPVKYPFHLTVKGKVYPLQRWAIKKLENGNINTDWHAYLNDYIPQTLNFQFERGDIVQTHFKHNRPKVTKGDTLLSITSLDLQIGLTRLREQLQVAKASLQVIATGQRRANILKAQQELAFATQQLERARQNYDRNKPLYESEVLPANEFEQITNIYELAIIEVDIAESRLLAAQTGKKPEEIALARARIKALSEELEVLEKKEAAYHIQAPFNGDLIPSDSLNEIVVLEDRSKLSLWVPIPLSSKEFLGDSIQISVPELFSIPLHISQPSGVYTLNQQQIFMVKLEVPGEIDLFVGQWVDCKIIGKPMGLLAYLKYLILPININNSSSTDVSFK